MDGCMNGWMYRSAWKYEWNLWGNDKQWQTAHRLQPEIQQHNAKEWGIGTCVFSVELSRISTAVLYEYEFPHFAYTRCHMGFPFPYRAPSHEVVWHGLHKPPTHQATPFLRSFCSGAEPRYVLFHSLPQAKVQELSSLLDFLFESWENPTEMVRYLGTLVDPKFQSEEEKWTSLISV